MSNSNSNQSYSLPQSTTTSSLAFNQTLAYKPAARAMDMSASLQSTSFKLSAPAPQPKAKSSGGFLSGVMNMFSGSSKESASMPMSAQIPMPASMPMSAGMPRPGFSHQNASLSSASYINLVFDIRLRCELEDCFDSPNTIASHELSAEAYINEAFSAPAPPPAMPSAYQSQAIPTPAQAPAPAQPQAPPALPTPTAPAPVQADSLVQTQTFSGSYPYNEQTIARLLKCSPASLQTSLGLSGEIFMTLVVVAYLKKYFNSQKYLLIVNKSISWLKSQGVVYKDIESQVLVSIV